MSRAVRIYDFGPPEPYIYIYIYIYRSICTVYRVYPYTMPPQIQHLSPHWANLSKNGTRRSPFALVFVSTIFSLETQFVAHVAVQNVLLLDPSRG
jgi:hypothetical protein